MRLDGFYWAQVEYEYKGVITKAINGMAFFPGNRVYIFGRYDETSMDPKNRIADSTYNPYSVMLRSLQRDVARLVQSDNSKKLEDWGTYCLNSERLEIAYLGKNGIAFPFPVVGYSLWRDSSPIDSVSGFTRKEMDFRFHPYNMKTKPEWLPFNGKIFKSRWIPPVLLGWR